MSLGITARSRRFDIAVACAAFLRVKKVAGLLVVAGAYDRELGVMEARYLSDDYATADGGAAVILPSAQGTVCFVASEAISVGDAVYGAAGGKVQATKAGVYRGQALTAASGDGAYVEVLVDHTAVYDLYTAIDASAAVTNTITETAFDNSVTIPANTLKAGDRIKIRCAGIATATNSTDTLVIKLKLGSTILAATATLDVADNDIFVIDMEVVIRTDGASGTLVASGFQIIGPPATATTKPVLLASTAIDTTATQLVSATATWSVASASNSCRMDVLSVSLAA